MQVIAGVGLTGEVAACAGTHSAAIDGASTATVENVKAVPRVIWAVIGLFVVFPGVGSDAGEGSVKAGRKRTEKQNSAASIPSGELSRVFCLSSISRWWRAPSWSAVVSKCMTPKWYAA